MKKILKIIIIVFFIIILMLSIKIIFNLYTYNKIKTIISQAKDKVSSYTNISISSNSFINDENITGVDNKIIIKNSIQCDTNNRLFAEENGIDYTIKNFDKNISYLVSPLNKKIYIDNIKEEEFYPKQLLSLISISDYKIINSNKYTFKEDDKNYIITIYNKKEDIYEKTYWISKETGLLSKEEFKYKQLNNNSEQCYINNYTYEFNTVTDEEIKPINLDNYTNYEIIDRK